MVMLTAQDILRIRMAMCLSPTEFAAQLKVSASAVCLWESGKRHPRWETLRELNKLAKLHNVRLDADAVPA